ncbi:LuxR C-terminal-related transcriptional regulator [Kitasatospora azatica]|uniref:LuxR C-terminal-related transcriptional regulator n=1 Tax=Kitasatospora azatica TaxID=58347 RepID=UPI000A4AF1E9|nr:LuxR C-terminal-related transcriptional regulator [Kitasatospora azatica]
MPADDLLAPAGAPELDPAARALYLAVLRGGGRLADHEIPEAERPALHHLVEAGLLIPQAHAAAYVAVSPRALTVRLGAEMRAQAVRLLVESESVNDRYGDLIRAYDRVAAPPAGRPVADWVHGLENIQKRISQLVSELRNELITVQPGHRPPELLESALAQDLPFLRRGGTLRTIYQPCALSAPATVCYAAEVTKHGGCVRILDEPFQRTFILDRSIAVIPAVEDSSTAVFVEDPAVVAHLLRVFERDWERAESVRWAQIRIAERSAPVAGRVGALLAQGLTQQGVARRLGISERTVAGHIARLRNRYGARTLFQLGWLMRGSSDEPPPALDEEPLDEESGESTR